MKNFFKQVNKNEQGFTLVELMVVVAIIGILSAVAIPNFKRYQAKTKTSEAKLQLSAIYSALTSLQSDYDAFATCLEDAGYVAPSGNSHYYALGFAQDNPDARAIVTANGGTCEQTKDGTDQFQFGAGKTVGGYKADAGDVGSINVRSVFNDSENEGNFDSPGVDEFGSYFVAGAVGAIDSDFRTPDTASQWVINENKALKEVVKGY